MVKIILYLVLKDELINTILMNYQDNRSYELYPKSIIYKYVFMILKYENLIILYHKSVQNF